MHHRHLRPARRTGDRLGTEGPVGGIGEFGAARRAHQERRHGGAGAVVGDGADDTEPRPAIGAGREGVAPPPRGGIADFPDAVRTHRGIRRHLGRGRPCNAVGDREFGGHWTRMGTDVDVLDAGERRRLAFLTLEERRDGIGAARDPHQHADGVVADVGRQTERSREAPHRRLEADALDPAADAGLQGTGTRGSASAPETAAAPRLSRRGESVGMRLASRSSSPHAGGPTTRRLAGAFGRRAAKKS